jgi:hypothetical protein
MATLPINELKGKSPTEICPILNLHRCKGMCFHFYTFSHLQLGDKGIFKPMVGEWTKENVPTFIPDEHIVQYNTHELTFPGLKPEPEYNFAAAQMVKSNDTGGAKRTTKKARKTRKCCRRKSNKKRISKNPHKPNNV